MTIIVEDGSIVANANSYVTAEELVAYAADRGVTITDPGTPPVSDYTNDGGTGDRTSDITVTTNVSLNGGTIDNLVDGLFALTSAQAVRADDDYTDGEYFQFDFGVGVNKYIDAFRIVGTDISLGNWIIQASDDAITWVTQKESFIINPSAAPGVAYTFTPTTAVGFRYWRILKDGTEALGSFDWLSEFEFKIDVGVPDLDTTAEDLIVKAMDYIEGQSFKGIKLTRDQALQWPRVNVIVDGYYLDSDDIPTLLKEAEMETAMSIHADVDPLANLEKNQKRVKVDVLEVEYFPGQSETFVRKISNKLRKLLINDGGSMIVRRG